MEPSRPAISSANANWWRTGRNVLYLGILAALLFCSACGNPAERSDSASAPSEAAYAPPVKTGAAALAERGFDLLDGKRVGLVVNHTARVDTTHLIDLIAAAPNVELAALFGPEHGLRGTADAGEKIADGRDERTGVPVYSLYGETRKPTPDMLHGADMLVFDIQDIGARFYTYISTMGLAMQAAAEQEIPFVVLDRPNPLGGNYVSGFVLEPEHTSFVGQYPIPMVHGMTVGELARMIRDESMMEGLDGLDLHVVEMEGWRRDMFWPDAGLPWIPPSPNIPDFKTALVYPGAVLFEATSASEGRGTRQPFVQVGAPWLDGQAAADSLNAKGLAGVRFEAIAFTPESIPGMASHPKLEGQTLEGIRHILTDEQAFRPVETGIHVLDVFRKQAASNTLEELVDRPGGMARLAGTQRLLDMLRQGASPETVIASWEREALAFRELREELLLYP